MPLILPRRSRLAFPAGSIPGFDLSHPAAQNCSVSGVSANGGLFNNIVTGKVGDNSTGPSTSTTSVYGNLSRVTNYVAATDNTAFPFVSPATVSVTLAGIFEITTNLASAAYILNTASASATGIGWNLGAGLNFSFVGGLGNTDNTGVPAVLGKPYFYAASFFGPAATNVIIAWVILRLDTGELRSGTTATVADGPIGVGDGNLWVGNRGANTRQLGGGIAAAMGSLNFMSEQQLRNWAQDPWAFWYPPSKTMNITSGGVTPPATVLYELINVM